MFGAFDNLMVRFLGDSSSAEAASLRVQGSLQEVHLLATSASASMSALFGVAVRGALNAAGQFEQTNIAFETMLGSAEETEQLLKSITDFAAKTPFEMPQIMPAVRGLVQFGERGEELMETLKLLGDVAASTGDNNNFGLLAMVFNQIRGVGRLLTEDFRQLSTRGVISLQDIADHFDVTTAKAQEMLSKGKISFEDVRAILKNLTDEGGRFNNLMERQSTSYLGLLSTISDNVGIEWRKLGSEMLPTAKILATGLNEFIGQLEHVPQPIKNATALVMGLGLAASMAASNFAKLAATLKTVGSLLGGMGTVAAIAIAATAGAVAWGVYEVAVGKVNRQLAENDKLQRAVARGVSQRMRRFESDIDQTTNPEERFRKIQEETAKAWAMVDDLRKQAQAALKEATAADQRVQEESTSILGKDLILSRAAVKASNEAKVAWNSYENVNRSLDQWIENLVKLEELNTRKRGKDEVEQYVKSLEEQVKNIGRSAHELQRMKWAAEGVEAEFLKTADAAYKNLENSQKLYELQQDFDAFVENMKLQQETIGMTSHELEVYRMQMRGLEGEDLRLAQELARDVEQKQKQHQEQLRKQQEMEADAVRVKDSIMTKAERQAREQEKLNELLKEGLISQDEHAKAVAKIGEAADQAKQKLQEMFDTVFKNTRQFHIDMYGLVTGDDLTKVQMDDAFLAQQEAEKRQAKKDKEAEARRQRAEERKAKAKAGWEPDNAEDAWKAFLFEEMTGRKPTTPKELSETSYDSRSLDPANPQRQFFENDWNTKREIEDIDKEIRAAVEKEARELEAASKRAARLKGVPMALDAKGNAGLEPGLTANSPPEMLKPEIAMTNTLLGQLISATKDNKLEVVGSLNV